jgi:hypothetical protein
VDDWTWAKGHKIELINLVGSIASIVGFVIVIIGMFSGVSDRDAETVLWQFVFVFLAVLAIAASILFFYFWIVEGLQRRPLNTKGGVATVFWKLCLGIVALGIAGDGALAAIQWKFWLYGPLRALDLLWYTLKDWR